jgi:hypothetical protein
MVSYSQQIDTLLGLEKGLLLCEQDCIAADRAKRQIIIPNGILENKKIDNCEHHQVDIDITDLKTPAFYSFEVDCYLKKLRAEESINAWLY